MIESGEGMTASKNAVEQSVKLNLKAEKEGLRELVIWLRR